MEALVLIIILIFVFVAIEMLVKKDKGEPKEKERIIPNEQCDLFFLQVWKDGKWETLFANSDIGRIEAKYKQIKREKHTKN